MSDEVKRLIGFSGPSGSGKTTLVNRLAEKLGCGKVTEVATDVFREWKEKHGFKSLAEIRMYSPTKFQLEVLREQIRREEEELGKHSLVLTDRTIYDNLFYAIFYHDDPELLDRYVREFRKREAERLYWKIFLCEPVLNVRDGKPRDLNARLFQEFVIRRLTSQPVIYLPAFGLEERIKYVLKTLQSGGGGAC